MRVHSEVKKHVITCLTQNGFTGTVYFKRRYYCKVNVFVVGKQLSKLRDTLSVGTG